MTTRIINVNTIFTHFSNKMPATASLSLYTAYPKIDFFAVHNRLNVYFVSQEINQNS